MNNIIDATAFFKRKALITPTPTSLEVSPSRGFKLYCSCIAELAIELVKSAGYYDEEIDADYIDFATTALIDTKMREPVTLTAKYVANEIITQCEDIGIIVSICQPFSPSIILGSAPPRVQLWMRIASRDA